MCGPSIKKETRSTIIAGRLVLGKLERGVAAGGPKQAYAS